MDIKYKKTRTRDHVLPMWLKITQDFNKGVLAQDMVNNPNYLTQSKKPYKKVSGIYYVLRQMKDIQI